MEDAKQIQKWVKTRKEQILQDIVELMDINTFVENPEAVNRGVDWLEKLLKKHSDNLSVERYSEKGSGDLLVVESKNLDNKKPKVLLSGHVDTVHPENIQKIKRTRNKIYGPGAVDMKAGLLVAIYAMIAATELYQVPNITLVISPDEEIGSTFFQKIRKKNYKNTDYGLVFEAAGDEGEFVSARKGLQQVRVISRGELGHAAYKSFENRNAIVELMKFLNHAASFASKKQDISVCVGMIKGGKHPNVIPDYAEVSLDFRAFTQAKVDATRKRIERLAKMSGVEIRDIAGIWPMENEPADLKEMRDMMEKVGENTGSDVVFQKRPGGSDGNQIAPHATCVIDGFGPIGSGSHTNEEVVEVKSIVERLVFSVCLLQEIFN